jgi:F-type H+-transporting ATPase subunit gamma
VALLVVTGDRGLCGGYNSGIIKKAELRAKELKAQGLNYTFVIVGRKASQYFQRREQPIAATLTGLEQISTAPEVNKIGDKIMAMFLGEEVDRVELVYTKFVSLIASRPVIQTLLPLSPQGLEVKDDEIFRLTTKGGGFEVSREKIFEQDPTQILASLLPLYLNNQLLRALQEAAASELAARMTAMNSASDNAKSLISSLTLTYNKARQAAITQEILEVVGGAEALQG